MAGGSWFKLLKEWGENQLLLFLSYSLRAFKARKDRITCYRGSRPDSAAFIYMEGRREASSKVSESHRS